MVELREHQKRAVSQLESGKVLWGGVGSGKTLAALSYYKKAYPDRDLYVITTAKKRDSLDWEGEAASLGIGKAKDATVAGVLTVDSWNNIGKYSEVENGFFVFDEQRLVGSGAWTKAFLKIAKRNHWILLSATPGDTWLDYIPVFIANGFYKNRTEFKWAHVVYSPYSKFPKVDRYIGVNKLVKLRNQILVGMDFTRHTIRHLNEVEVSYDDELLKKVVEKRWHVFEERPIKNVAELLGVMRRVVNSHSSRLRELDLVQQRWPRVIVFYNFNYELEILRRYTQDVQTQRLADIENYNQKKAASDSSAGCVSRTSVTSSHTKRSTTSTVGSMPGSNVARHIKTGTGEPKPIQVAEWNGQKHEEVPDSDDWIYLVQYTAGAEGWNCVETNAMVFFSLNYSYKIFEQAQGRIDRLNTSYANLHYFILKSKSSIDRAIWKALTDKKRFNEREFAEKELESADFG